MFREIVKQLKIKCKDFSLSDFDTSIEEIFDEIKSAIYHHLEYLVFRMELTYNEVMDVLDIKYFPSEKTGYTLPPGLYEISDINKS